MPEGGWCGSREEGDGGCGAAFEGLLDLGIGGGKVGGGVEGVVCVEGGVGADGVGVVG